MRNLFLCQSAISASLNRLRQFFDDPLFIRMGRTMEPTSRAFEIQLTLTPALDNMAAALSNVSEFDPTTSTNVFRIGLSDDVEYSLLPGLLRQLGVGSASSQFRRAPYRPFFAGQPAGYGRGVTGRVPLPGTPRQCQTKISAQHPADCFKCQHPHGSTGPQRVL